ncbi:hypothetical protein [Nocardia sp. NPDC057272]|uniref:hypothetical protein n=1 Tax=Nocardia sp. NPDC057272 TaxID=3346079 RepID=UPI00362FDC2D
MNAAHDNANDEFLVRVRDYTEQVLRPAAGLFVLVQGQTTDVRRAQLAALAR